jgi:hypothetical protein
MRFLPAIATASVWRVIDTMVTSGYIVLGRRKPNGVDIG